MNQVVNITTAALETMFIINNRVQAGRMMGDSRVPLTTEHLSHYFYLKRVKANQMPSDTSKTTKM